MNGNLAAEEKVITDKPNIGILSEKIDEADRQIHIKTKITSLESLKSELLRYVETDRSNGMLNLYCKLCGQKGPSQSLNLKLHIATHFNITIPCVFKSGRKFTAHTIQVHGKGDAESQDNIVSVSIKQNFQLTTLCLRKQRANI